MEKEKGECCRCGEMRVLHVYKKWQVIYRPTLCKKCIKECDEIGEARQ